MTYTPSAGFQNISSKTQIRWIADDEDVNTAVTSRPMEDLADMILTLRKESNITVINDTAIAMSIALA